MLASGSKDDSIKLWNAATGKLLKTLKAHTAGVTFSVAGVSSVAFSPDGRSLASGSLDGTIKIQDVATGKLLRTFSRSDVANSVTFSPNGMTLASGIMDDTIVLWDVATGQPMKTLKTLDLTTNDNEEPQCNWVYSALTAKHFQWQ